MALFLCEIYGHSLNFIFARKKARDCSLAFLLLAFLVLEADRFLDPNGQSRKVFTAEISEFVGDDIHTLTVRMNTPVVFFVASHVVRQNLTEMLSREVAVRVVRDEPVVVVVHVEQIVVLAVVDDILLFNECRVDTTLANLFEERHINGSQMEVSVNDAGKMLSCAVVLRTSLKGQNTRSIDYLKDASEVVEDLEEFLKFFRRKPGKAHDVPFGYNHKVTREECASARNNEKALSFVQDVLGIFCLTTVDVTKQTVAGGLGNLVAGVLSLVVAHIDIERVHNSREILDDIISAEDGRVDVGFTFVYPNDNRIVTGQGQTIVAAEVQCILVAGIYCA